MGAPNVDASSRAPRRGHATCVLRSDDIVVVIDCDPSVRRIGVFFFNAPAVAVVIANDGCRRAGRQSKGGEEADNSAFEILLWSYS